MHLAMFLPAACVCAPLPTSCPRPPAHTHRTLLCCGTQVYDWDSHQATVFDITARPIVDACMDGYNGAATVQHHRCTGRVHVLGLE